MVAGDVIIPIRADIKLETMIFHIAQEADWSAAQTTGEYKALSLATEGFIHCSDQHQVLEVAHRLFKGRQDLVLLNIDPSRLEVVVRYENCEGGQELYPHVYGCIPLAAVITVCPLRPNAAGKFTLPAELSD